MENLLSPGHQMVRMALGQVFMPKYLIQMEQKLTVNLELIHILMDLRNPAISELAGGGFVISWQSIGQDGDQSGIVSRIFDGNGSPQVLKSLVTR